MISLQVKSNWLKEDYNQMIGNHLFYVRFCLQDNLVSLLKEDGIDLSRVIFETYELPIGYREQDVKNLVALRKFHINFSTEEEFVIAKLALP